MKLIPIPGYECYAAGDDGEIYRIKYCDNGNATKRKVPHKLIPSYDKNGYKRVILSEKNHRRYCRSNRLVALAFLPNPNNYPVVNHLNGDKKDNRPFNLEWTSWRANVIHAHNTGLHKGCRTSVTLKRESNTLYFPTIVDASQFLKHSRDCFARHLTFDANHGVIDGWDFELNGGKTRKKVVKNEIAP